MLLSSWRACLSIGLQMRSGHHLNHHLCERYTRRGGTFVTGSLDRTVLVWSADDGQALARAAVHGSPVLWVAASSGPDGTRVRSCAADGAGVWPVEVLREAQRRAPRDLSPFERLELEALVGGGS